MCYKRVESVLDCLYCVMLKRDSLAFEVLDRGNKFVLHLQEYGVEYAGSSRALNRLARNAVWENPRAYAAGVLTSMKTLLFPRRSWPLLRDFPPHPVLGRQGRRAQA